MLNLEQKQVLIVHNSKKKFRDYTPTEAEIIVKEFNIIALKLGINQPLEQWACVDLAKFCVSEFKDFSLSEIYESILKYNADKLDFKEGHFQNLSQKFIGSLLKSYRTYRNKALMKYHKELENMEKETPPTPEELKQIEQDYLEAVLFKPYQNAIENDLYLSIDENVAVDLFAKLYKKGTFKLDRETLKAFRDKGILEIQKPVKNVLNKLDRKNINELVKKLRLIEKGDLDDKELELKIKEKASALYFNDWINKQLDEKNDIKQYFE